MRGEAMKRVCDHVHSAGTDMSHLVALEFFAREGDWQTAVYAPLVSSLEAWEIDPAFEPRLRVNLPTAKVRIGDSYQMAKEPENRHKFSWIVFDNPQGLFGPDGRYCEHFEALRLAPELLSDEGWLIFNVNWHPFGYEKHPEWKARREEFYGHIDTANLSLAGLMIFYRQFLSNLGLRVIDIFCEPRNNEYLSYVVARVGR